MERRGLFYFSEKLKMESGFDWKDFPPEFTFRPNLKKASHREAWEILQSVPMREKSNFVVQAILKSVRQEELKSLLRRVLREELRRSPPPMTNSEESAVPQEMMDFLGSLMNRE